MIELLSDIFTERVILRNTLITVILFVAVVLIRSLAIRSVRRVDWASEQVQLRWTDQIRWASMLFLTFGIVFVWASEIRTLALSVVAIAVALVIATKEFILCISGAALRATSACYSIGDRIEIGGIRGDVVVIGLFTTTILEIGPVHRRTGRAIVFPNSMLMDKPVTNETFTDDFVLHMISVPVGTQMDWKIAERCLVNAANEICAPFLDEARKYMNETAKRHGLPGFSVEPGVSIQVPEAGKLNLLLRVPSRAQEKGLTEQRILRRFLENCCDNTNS